MSDRSNNNGRGYEYACLHILQNHINTLLLCMDNGWAFTFRIHNAEEICTPSLKFDVQIIGVPTTIISINCPWN